MTDSAKCGPEAFAVSQHSFRWRKNCALQRERPRHCHPMKVLRITLALVAMPAVAQQAAVDTVHSQVTVRVYKSGLFSGLAHNHVVKAPIASGSLDAEHRLAQLTLNPMQMKVTDPEGSDSERQEIESTMKGPQVLDAERFPSINFQSQSIVALAAGRYQVTGELKLHGVTRPLTLTVTFNQNRYTASVTLKQTDFGIVPIKIAGGTVRVKDEIDLSFEIVPLARP
jgi:polyisoprenoid-binding protein YceI